MAKAKTVQKSSGDYLEEAAKYTDKALSADLHVATMAPVIYAGAGSGGGPGEYIASSDPNVANQYELNVPGAKTIFAAFYQPLHNIPDMSKFALVDVTPHSAPGDILLSVASWPGYNGRVRIKITILYSA